MFDALSELASINSQLSARLYTILEQIGVHANIPYNANGHYARGIAYFTAFHPLDSCLRFPPLTGRFFQDAVKFDVLSNASAREISWRMARCCQQLRLDYNGAFSSILNTGIFKDFLVNGMGQKEFLRWESVHGWCGDAFASAFPWAVMQDFHLGVAGYRPANLSRRTILAHASGPFMRFMNAIDIAVLGAWAGYDLNDVTLALSWLEGPYDASFEEDVVLTPPFPAERLIIPLYSYGFQGAVSGVFTGLNPNQKDLILKTVLHFGQSMADTYASLRRSECLAILQAGRDAGSVANALIRVTSPVQHLVVELNGRSHSFSLKTENGYWAGYRENAGAAAAELARKLLSEGKSTVTEQSYMGDRFRLIVQPLQEQHSLDPVFAWMSMQTRLSEIMNIAHPAGHLEPLTLSMLMAMREELDVVSAPNGEDGADRLRGDFGRQKRLCIIELVIENYERGEVELTNYALKTRLERKLGPRASARLNGYQIAGKAAQRVANDFPEEFRRRVKFGPVGANKVRLSWRCD